jgi:hypothetical protein
LHSIPFLGLYSASRARKPREGHRELLHRIPSSSSSLTRGRLHRRRGNLRISTDLTPYQISLQPRCNPLILGAFEYKDHQLLDVGHRLVRTRINWCVLSVILVFLSPPEPPKTCTLTSIRTTMLVTVPTPRQLARQVGAASSAIWALRWPEPPVSLPEQATPSQTAMSASLVSSLSRPTPLHRARSSTLESLAYVADCVDGH